MRKSDTAAAIRCASSRWQALTRYVNDGQLEIDNNAAERALRVVALGRKNSSSADQTQAANAPPPSTRCSEAPSSTGSILNSISIKSSNGSQTTPSAGSRICCHGTSPSPRHRTHLNKCPPKIGGHLSPPHTHRNGPDQLSITHNSVGYGGSVVYQDRFGLKSGTYR
jgi:hypothetical protein